MLVLVVIIVDWVLVDDIVVYFDCGVVIYGFVLVVMSKGLGCVING